MNRKITSEQAQTIISVACREWKETLFNKWGKSIALRDIIEVNDDFYAQMRHACSVSQNEVLDDIFGKDVTLNHKVGDWIIDKDAIYPAVQIIGIGIAGSYEYKCNYEKGFYTEDFCRAATDVEIAKAKYKDGDYIYIGKETVDRKSVVKLIKIKGTPCLVRDYDDSSWILAYSDGDGTYITRSGANHWQQVVELDINSLPKYNETKG